MSANPEPIAPASRAERTRERILSTATQILLRHGYASLTMERVALESGVAKTTLYRRWPTKASLCTDLYLDVAERELRDPDTGNVVHDMQQVARTVAHLQTRTVAGPALRGLIAEAQLNPEERSSFLAEFAERRRSVTRPILRRAIDRGELRADTDVELVIDVIGGAVTFRLLQGHAPLTPEFTDAVVSLVLSACRPQDARKRSL